jgi:hypothetical protein
VKPSIECPAIKGTFIVFPSPALEIPLELEEEAHDLLPFLPLPAVESDLILSNATPDSRGRVSFESVCEGVTLGLRRSRPRVGVCGFDISIEGAEREHDEYKRRLSMLIV